MKRFLLLALAVTVGLGLMQGEAFAKNNKNSDFDSRRIDRSDDRGNAREKWREMSPAQRSELQERYQRFQELSPEEQQKLRRRYERFKDLPPEKQQQMLERHHRIQQLSPQQRQQLRREWQHLKEIPPEQRSQRRREIHREYFGDDHGWQDDRRGEERGRRR